MIDLSAFEKQLKELEKHYRELDSEIAAKIWLLESQQQTLRQEMRTKEEAIKVARRDAQHEFLRNEIGTIFVVSFDSSYHDQGHFYDGSLTMDYVGPSLDEAFKYYAFRSGSYGSVSIMASLPDMTRIRVLI